MMTRLVPGDGSLPKQTTYNRWRSMTYMYLRDVVIKVVTLRVSFQSI